MYEPKVKQVFNNKCVHLQIFPDKSKFKSHIWNATNTELHFWVHTWATKCLGPVNNMEFWVFSKKVQNSNFLVIQTVNIALNLVWASYAFSWEIESYPRKPFENVKNLKNWMNKTSFSFWDRVKSGLSKSCSKSLCKYETSQTSQAAPRVHMFSIF